MKINKEWHLAHKMPERATMDQRITWHLEHLAACSCRAELPAGIIAEMKKRHMTIPTAKQHNMDKLDLKKEYSTLYKVKANDIAIVDVPTLPYLMCDGHGDPNTSPIFRDAVEALYSIAYTIKFDVKKAGGQDFAVMPLEGQWWADDMSAFAMGNREKWKWTMMILQPSFITAAMVEEARKKVMEKKDVKMAAQVVFGEQHEGTCAQLLHIGPYSKEAENIQRLHRFIADNGYKLHGKHREVYLSDMRRTAPEKLKTIIRQPMAR